jgi:general secretion pathway protein G
MMKKRNEDGFTLIELMVVVIILGILAGLVIPKIVGKPEEARRVKAKIQIQNFKKALRLFYLDNSFYPSTEQGLKALIKKPTTGRIPRHYRKGGYLEGNKIPKDPWGNPYVYISPGVHDKDFDIISLGADGEEGGEENDADIESWNLDNDNAS